MPVPVPQNALSGQLFALLYAGAFVAIGQATWWWGGLFGSLHAAAALVILVPLLPGVHPRMASARAGPTHDSILEPPGFLALNYGIQTPLVTFISHVVYGILLGTFLSPEEFRYFPVRIVFLRRPVGLVRTVTEWLPAPQL